MFAIINSKVLSLTATLIVLFCVQQSSQLCNDYNLLVNKFEISDGHLLNGLSKLYNSCNRLSHNVEKFDARDIKSNGLRSFLSVLDKFFTKIVKVQKRNTNAKIVPIKIKDATDVLLSMLDIVESIVSGQSSKSKFAVTRKFLNFEERKLRSLMELETFWLTSSMRTPLILYRALHCFTLHEPFHFQVTEVGHNYDAAAKFAVNGDVFQLKKLWKFWEAHSERNSSEVLVKKIQSPRQFQHVIKENGKIVAQSANHEREDQTIDSLLIRSGRPSGDLVLHAHGGGFVELRPLAHSLYIGRWARNMPGVTFLSVDYRLSPEHKYPRGLQDILDVYLWLLSTDHRTELKESLGFVPKRIIIFGDSAGGNLGLALLRVLHAINAPLPDGLFFLYPHTTLRLANVSKISKVMMVLDPILSISTFFSFTEAYSPGHFNYNRSSEPWHRTKQLESRIIENESKSLSDPIYNPLLTDLEPFKSIQLTVIAAQFDPLLDDAVELVRKWPSNNVDFHVIKGQTHAFPLSIDLSNGARRDTDFCGHRLAELLNYGK